MEDGNGDGGRDLLKKVLWIRDKLNISINSEIMINYINVDNLELSRDVITYLPMDVDINFIYEEIERLVRRVLEYDHGHGRDIIAALIDKYKDLLSKEQLAFLFKLLLN